MKEQKIRYFFAGGRSSNIPESATELRSVVTHSGGGIWQKGYKKGVYDITLCLSNESASYDTDCAVFSKNLVAVNSFIKLIICFPCADGVYECFMYTAFVVRADRLNRGYSPVLTVSGAPVHIGVEYDSETDEFIFYAQTEDK